MKTITKNYMRYFNSLGDCELLKLIQDIAGIVTDRYKVIIRSKSSILISNNWDNVRIDEEGIWVKPYCPPYNEYCKRRFDKYFCIRLYSLTNCNVDPQEKGTI